MLFRKSAPALLVCLVCSPLFPERKRTNEMGNWNFLSPGGLERYIHRCVHDVMDSVSCCDKKDYDDDRMTSAVISAVVCAR